MKKFQTPLLKPKDRARGKMLVAKEENPPPAENCLLERQSKKGPPHQPPVRTKPGALSPPRATRGGATRKILWVNLLKARTIGEIPKKNPSNPPQSHPSPEPASIPWHPLRAGRKGWCKVGGAIRIPAGPPARGWRFGRARQLARRERGKRVTPLGWVNPTSWISTWRFSG